MRLVTYLLGIASIFIISSNAQYDPQLCPNGATTIKDPKWRSVPPRFEVIAELAASDGVMEVSQAFSPTRDAILANAKTQLQFYWNYLTDEHFDILTAVVGTQAIPQCVRTPLTPQSQTSVIISNTLLLKPSALLGYTPRNQPNPDWGVNYVEEGDLRGIPTHIFRSCFFASDIRAYVAATYHISDPDKFQGYLGRNQTQILQIDVKLKNELGREEIFSYNIFRYVPNPRQREERQALETPGGVFCPNRTQTLRVPGNIPDRASSSVESFIPFFNNSIISSHSLYDTEFQYSRFDAWYPDPSGGPAWLHMTELHDFAVGLSYHFNHSNRQCSVRNLDNTFNDAVNVDGNPNLLQMGDPRHLFLMDDIRFVYTGEKRCRDRVWCHVWIGEKEMPNNTAQHREWYWASSINGEPLAQWIPMKLVIKQMLFGIPIATMEMSVFNFRRNPLTILEIEFTLAECYRALGPAENFNLAVLSFKIGNDKKFPVNQNLNSLRLHIWETLLFTMFVRPTRLSHLVVDQDGDDIIVSFTLLDAPPRTGPVEDPIHESSLDTLIDHLETAINSKNGLRFRARAGSRQVHLFARSGSLNVDHKTNRIVYQSSGPKITGLWIGLIVVGLALGVIGGYFAFRKLATK